VLLLFHFFFSPCLDSDVHDRVRDIAALARSVIAIPTACCIIDLRWIAGWLSVVDVGAWVDPSGCGWVKGGEWVWVSVTNTPSLLPRGLQPSLSPSLLQSSCMHVRTTPRNRSRSGHTLYLFAAKRGHNKGISVRAQCPRGLCPQILAENIDPENTGHAQH
jgi:hypothetical protein